MRWLKLSGAVALSAAMLLGQIGSGAAWPIVPSPTALTPMDDGSQIVEVAMRRGGGGGGMHRGGGGGGLHRGGGGMHAGGGGFHRGGGGLRFGGGAVHGGGVRVGGGVHRGGAVAVRGGPVRITGGAYRPWVRRPYFGTTILGGIALGTIIAVAVAGVAPIAPAPNMCWYWSDPNYVSGYWDYCVAP